MNMLQEKESFRCVVRKNRSRVPKVSPAQTMRAAGIGSQSMYVIRLRPRASLWNVLMLGTLLGCSDASPSVQQVFYDEAASQPACVLHLAVLRVLDRTLDSLAPVSVSRIVGNTNGDFLVSPVKSGRNFAVFSSNGALKAVGKPPNTWRADSGGPLYARGSRDSLGWILSQGRRVWAYAGLDIEPPMMTMESPFFSVAWDTEQSPVLLGRIATRDRAGFPLHLVGNNGAIGKSFGSAGGLLLPGESAVDERVMAADGSGGVWTASVNDYILQHYDARGRLLRDLRRQPSWFTAEEGTDEDGIKGPAPSVVRGIAIGSNGHIWVSGTVGNARWKILKETRGDSSTTSTDRIGHLDTVVEVWEQRGWRLIASTRVEDFAGVLVAPGIVAAPSYDHSGQLQIEIHTVKLIANEPRGAPTISDVTSCKTGS